MELMTVIRDASQVFVQCINANFRVGFQIR